MWYKVARTVGIFCRFYPPRAASSSGNCSPTARFELSGPWRRRISSRMSGGEETQESAGDAGKSQTPETPPGFLQVTEGRAKILFPSAEEVFYNPVQEVNRDLRYIRT